MYFDLENVLVDPTDVGTEEAAAAAAHSFD